MVLGRSFAFNSTTVHQAAEPLSLVQLKIKKISCLRQTLCVCVRRDRPLSRGRQKPCLHAYTHTRHTTACYHITRTGRRNYQPPSAFVFFFRYFFFTITQVLESDHVWLPQIKDLPEQRRLLHLQDQVLQFTLHGQQSLRGDVQALLWVKAASQSLFICHCNALCSFERTVCSV